MRASTGQPLPKQRVARLLHAGFVVTPSAHNDPPGRERRDERVPRELTDAAPDPVLSGADAVEKTTYAGDVHGADVNGNNVPPGGVTARVRSGGTSPVVWIAAILAILALVAYVAGFFS